MGYRFLFSSRWIALHLFVIFLVTLFVILGLWQLRRHNQVITRNTLIISRLAAEPESFEVIAGRYDLGALPVDFRSAAYRRAVVSGYFDSEYEVLLRSRSRDGVPGWHVLTPLVMESGQAILVDRGWVPYELGHPSLHGAAPPKGGVKVIGTLIPGQVPRGRFSARDPPEGRLEAVFWVDLSRIMKQLPYDLESLYLEMSIQDPPQKMLPFPPNEAELTNGPHLGYAIQWFAFALIGLVGYGVLIRKTQKFQH